MTAAVDETLNKSLTIKRDGIRLRPFEEFAAYECSLRDSSLTILAVKRLAPSEAYNYEDFNQNPHAEQSMLHIRPHRMSVIDSGEPYGGNVSVANSQF